MLKSAYPRRDRGYPELPSSWKTGPFSAFHEQKGRASRLLSFGAVAEGAAQPRDAHGRESFPGDRERIHLSLEDPAQQTFVAGHRGAVEIVRPPKSPPSPPPPLSSTSSGSVFLPLCSPRIQLPRGQAWEGQAKFPSRPSPRRAGHSLPPPCREGAEPPSPSRAGGSPCRRRSGSPAGSPSPAARGRPPPARSLPLRRRRRSGRRRGGADPRGPLPPRPACC